MNPLRRLCLVASLLAAPCVLGQTPAASTSTTTDPQLVRVSLVEGDVRVSRGKAGEKATGAAWEKAAVDLPLESGFSLVTGDGRAEIEFEDASTVYLGPNSVLVFNDLNSTGGIPRTDIALLSGTLSVNATPMAAGEVFRIKTPTDGISVKYPNKTFVRINSYLDAMSVTAQAKMLSHLSYGSALSSVPGETTTFRHGQRVFDPPPSNAQEMAAWDSWVQQQVSARETAMTAVMKDAGLSAPVPGLAEMNAQGTFTPCAPYGTCWEPKNGWGEAQAEPQTVAQNTVSVATLQKQGLPGGGKKNSALKVQFLDDFFPCSPVPGRFLPNTAAALGTFRPIALYRNRPYPYEWVVCHTGSWIHREHRYVWVAGRERHHHGNWCWVKTPKGVGFVPIHPKDEPGKLPVNLKYGVIRPLDRGAREQHLAFAEGEKVKLLPEAPKDFRKPQFAALARAEEPHVLAYRLHEATRDALKTGKGEEARVAGTPVTFDHKTQSFMIARPVQEAGGASRMVSEPIGGRGSPVQAHAGNDARGFSGGGSNSSASVSRGSSSGGYSSGGNSSSASASHVSAAPSAPAAAPAASFSGGASSAAASSASTGAAKSK